MIQYRKKESIMELFIVILMGLCIGSFLNVCIYRIPNEESIAFPPSHCSECEHDLGVFDLIPVISYIFLRGKCRYCKSKISIQYPLIELLNAFMYSLSYMRYGFTIDMVKFSVLFSILIVIAVIDAKTQDVYRNTTIFGFLSGISFLIIEYFLLNRNVLSNVGGLLIGISIIGLIVFLTKGNGMGEGDIEIAAVMGIYLGISNTVLALFLAVVIAGIYGTVVLIIGKKKFKNAIAFGPFLAIGAMISSIYGNVILNWYLNSF